MHGTKYVLKCMYFNNQAQIFLKTTLIYSFNCFYNILLKMYIGKVWEWPSINSARQ